MLADEGVQIWIGEHCTARRAAPEADEPAVHQERSRTDSQRAEANSDSARKVWEVEQRFAYRSNEIK